MNTTKCSTIARNALCLTGGAVHKLLETNSMRTMKKAALISLVLAAAGIAGAANVPSGLTGLWRFQDASSLGAATIGNDIMFGPNGTNYGVQYLGPWTDIGIESWQTKFSDGAIFQESSWNYLAVNPSFTANGGGDYVNQYTVAIDYVQTQTGWNSLFQTSYGGNDNDGDLWIAPDGTIGVGDVGYSTMTFDSSTWHRIVWSVDNSSFFRVYVDGTLFLDGAGQGVDGRFSLYPDRFNLFADDSWEDMWGLVGTVATWNRALTTEEIAGMGGWIGTNDTPTPLLFSDALPSLMSVSPANGETNVLPGFAYQAIILDLDSLVDTNSILLLLDGAPVTPVVTATLAQKVIKFSAGGLLLSGSTHKYTLIAAASGTYSTNEVTFKVQNYTDYEWRFTNGDLSAALGNGVMSYAEETYTPGLTSFGTTDGSTVPHINGSPAKYMHVPGFTDDTYGYLLQFNNSGPNVGGNPKINRYTLLMDILVPGPWSLTWIVPFFNTDPFNLDDADFYLYGDGSIGTGAAGYGAAGYSATNVMTPNTWYRVAFVADLKADTLTYYVNGTMVKSRPGDGLGETWSLYSNQDAGADLFLFNEGDTSGTYTHELYLSSVAFIDRAISGAEAAALGGPKATGILVPSFTPAPTLACQRSGNGVVISWPTNYVGYSLVGKTSLGSGTWFPVPGVTNNAALLPAGSTSQFFRLVQ
jgi:Concanavalin A-like lectin/glucanases superfamily